MRPQRRRRHVQGILATDRQIGGYSMLCLNKVDYKISAIHAQGMWPREQNPIGTPLRALSCLANSQWKKPLLNYRWQGPVGPHVEQFPHWGRHYTTGSHHSHRTDEMRHNHHFCGNRDLALHSTIRNTAPLIFGIWPKIFDVTAFKVQGWWK